MAASVSSNSPILLLFFILAVASSAAAVLSPDSCDQNVDFPLPFPASSLSCQVVWSPYNFILRYNYDKSSNVLSIVLSANFLQNWFAIGFSPSGRMLGSSAMVGYFNDSGVGHINQYYLAGYRSDKVFPFEGNLSVIKESEMVTVENHTIYMVFQLSIKESSAASSQLIYAYAYQHQLPDSTTGVINNQHQADFQNVLDFTTGATTSTSSPTDKMRSSHGIINIIGWAVFAPIGIFIARYFQQWDPLWFYLHIGFQSSAFLLAVTGGALGIKLTQDLPTDNWHSHRALGIFILVLGALQVVALCARPRKDSKSRLFWNWYHHTVGWIVILLAAVNVWIGLKVAGAGPHWKASYAVVFVLILVSFIILESIYWCKWRERLEPIRPRTTFSNYGQL